MCIYSCFGFFLIFRKILLWFYVKIDLTFVIQGQDTVKLMVQEKRLRFYLVETLAFHYCDFNCATLMFISLQHKHSGTTCQ